MDWLTFMRVFLAVVFVLSAVGKFYDRRSFKVTLFEIGFKRLQVEVLTWLVPTVELVFALLLFFPLTAKIDQVGIALLLLSFITVSIRMMIQGKTVSCNCFGSTGSGALGWSSIFRSLVLGVVDGILGWKGINGFELHPLFVATATVISIGVVVSYLTLVELFKSEQI